uniref:Uncharacterized protein n=1 Tax=Araucaria cunninghamii TaxID=56994 RepID=A0A0D6QRF2_ARACU
MPIVEESSRELKVEIVRTCIVRSPVLSPDCWLKGSNIDLTVPSISPGHFFVYKRFADKTYGEVVSSMKKALSETLLLFYPVAGRFRVRKNGEAEIHCSNQGVPFAEGLADAAIADVDFSQPSLSVGGKLSPTRQPLQGEAADCLPVLAVQVTRMKCGGIVVSCSFDHRIVDGISSSNFFKAWSEAAQGLSISMIPCFKRSLLEPRRPLDINADIDSHYVAIPFAAVDDTKQLPAQIGRIYHLDAASLQRLQALANQTVPEAQQGKPKTKLEAVSAYIWRLVARAQALCPSEPTRIGIPIDGRAYLNLPHSYFGNAIAIPFTQTDANEILDKPLSAIAEIVHNVIRCSTNSEYFRSFVDWVESKRPAMMLAKVYAEARSAVVVSSGVRIPIYEIDLGCGKPAFSSAYFPWGGTAGYVMVQASPLGDGNWVVYMHMAEKDLDAIEGDPDFIFVRASQMNFW